MTGTKNLIWLLFLICFSVSAMNQEESDQKNLQSQSQASLEPCCPILELRQYNLIPGKRDILINLFDREFVESQEALGMRIIGQFQDLDNPNHFVWLRGFPNMTIRQEALKSFYSGPVWKANRQEANSTMVDVDNVLLLHPALPNSGFSLENAKRPPVGTTQAGKGLVIATIYYLNAPADKDFIDYFELTVKPALKDAGASVLASFVTENSPNNFPALPVREGIHILVWFSMFQDQTGYEDFVSALAQSEPWRTQISKEITNHLKGSPEVLRLSPTPRSLLQE